ncbi:MAG: hypothetical protein R3C16_01975 [Hyphomonadaceae bacterium]
MLRAGDLPMLCYAAAVEASQCLIIDPLSHAPAMIVAFRTVMLRAALAAMLAAVRAPALAQAMARAGISPSAATSPSAPTASDTLIVRTSTRHL